MADPSSKIPEDDDEAEEESTVWYANSNEAAMIIAATVANILAEIKIDCSSV